MLLKDGTILVITILIQGWPMQPVCSESVSGESVGPRKEDAGGDKPPSSAGVDNNYNRVAGLAMHPVNDHNQRKGREEDRKGGGTTVAGEAPPRVLLPILF